jgi:hypothetical protein
MVERAAEGAHRTEALVKPKVKRGARLVRDKPAHPGPSFEFHDNMARIARADPEGGPPAGSVDLLSLNYAQDDAARWGQHVRLQDVVTSIRTAEMVMLEVTSEKLVEYLNSLQDILENDITALDQRLAGLELENKALQDEVADLATRLQRVSAARGAGDGRDLPAGLTTPPKARPAKRRPAKQAPSAGVSVQP